MAEALREWLREEIRSLAGLHGPSGREQAVVAALAERLRPLAESVRIDQMGNVFRKLRRAGGRAPDTVGRSCG